MNELSLRDLIAFSRDGEWGSSEPLPGTTRMRVIRGTDFDSVRIGDLSAVPERWIDSTQAQRKRLQPDDILIESAGGSRDQITGRTLLVKESAIAGIPTTCASFSRVIRVDRTKILPQYLYWFLQNDHRNGDMHLYHLQHTGVSRFQFTEYARRTRVPIPDPKVQRRISRLLGALENTIELNHRTNRALETLATSLFVSWFVDFDPVTAKRDENTPVGVPGDAVDLFPSHFEDSELGPIPEMWVVTRLGDRFEITMGQSAPGSTYNEAGEGLPFYQGRTDFGFRFPRRRVYCTAPTRFADLGDTLVSVRAPVGDANMASERCAIGRGVAAVRHKDNRPSFTYYAIHSLRDEFDVFESQGTLFGAIGGEEFRQIRFAHPPDPILRAFEELVAPMDALIRSNERESRALAALRDTLLGPLLSGGLTIKAAEDVVEAAV
jgi:type I restriction enzyme S subunit